MPELPDVQVFKEYLDATALHQEIAGVSVRDDDVLQGISARTLRRRLRNREFESARRHGKHLFARLSEDGWLRLHFGMTGFLEYYKNDCGPEHVRARIDFSNGYHLAYDCQRKFGELGLVEDVDRFIEARDLGPDPLDSGFDLDAFRRVIEGRRGGIKSLLMNQSAIAGIGNIYSDEILFQAGIHPATRVDALDEQTVAHLYRTMRRVLEKAIECRVDPDRFPRSWLTPRRGEADRCPKCDGALKSDTIAGRTAYYCAQHQRRDR